MTYQPLGGGNLEALSRLQVLESKAEQQDGKIKGILESRGNADTFGLVKLSNAETVTESNGLALPTSEKNASVPGTLANKIQLLNQDKRISYAWGTPTPVAENIQSFSGQWQAYGGICMVYFQGIITMENAWELRDILRDCPHMIFGYPPWGVAHHQETCKAYMIGANNEGVIHIRADGVPQTGWYRGTITYAYAL